MRYLLLFILFFAGHIIYQFYNMFLAKNSSSLIIFSTQYSSHLSFSLMSLLIFTPFLSLANLGFGIGFQLGYKWFSDIWQITTLFIFAQLFSTVTLSVILFNQSFQKGPFLGFVISIIGLLVSSVWK